jgi:DNA-binding response OmpR family regulator
MKHEPVLIVDDHPHMARALATLVRAFGYEADVVHGGEQALEHVRSHPTGLVLLDLQMPGVSGWDVLRALRADARFAYLPVVVCSALSANQARADALAAGAQDYVVKSEAFEELEGALERHMNRGAAHAAGR